MELGLILESATPPSLSRWVAGFFALLDDAFQVKPTVVQKPYSTETSSVGMLELRPSGYLLLRRPI